LDTEGVIEIKKATGICRIVALLEMAL